MNYTQKASTGNSLTFPLLQTTVQIGNGELKNLLTSPYEILPAGYNYVVINAYLDYRNNNLNSGSNLFIGYEALLGVQIASAFCDFDTTYIGTNNGNIGLGTKSRNFYISNSNNTQPLVLWQQIDDASANYDRFDLTITYLRFP